MCGSGMLARRKSRKKICGCKPYRCRTGKPRMMNMQPILWHMQKQAGVEISALAYYPNVMTADKENKKCCY